MTDDDDVDDCVSAVDVCVHYHWLFGRAVVAVAVGDCDVVPDAVTNDDYDCDDCEYCDVVTGVGDI